MAPVSSRVALVLACFIGGCECSTTSTSRLIQALVDRNASLAFELISHGSEDVSALDVITPLYAAQQYISRANVRRKLLKRLIAAGADADGATQDGTTPLMLAAYQGDLKSVQVLLDAGADPLRCNDDGYNAVTSAMGRGHRELADDLSAHSHDAWTELVGRVEAHVGAVHAQLERLYREVCRPSADQPATLPTPDEQAVGDVNVPSCAALREAGLEEYYGNLNMLLVEAWRAKVLGALRNVSDSWKTPPQAELLRAGGAERGEHSGGIFVMELSPTATGGGTMAVLMIGIHRMPMHKARRLLGAAGADGADAPRAPPVTDALVGMAKEWCDTRRFIRLFVCPYAGLEDRLQPLGFSPVDDPDIELWFGHLKLRGGVCEDAQLHAYDCVGFRAGTRTLPDGYRPMRDAKREAEAAAEASSKDRKDEL